jgi:hypothetical protein
VSRRRREFGSVLFAGPPVGSRFSSPDEAAGPGTANPLLDESGDTRVHGAFGATRRDGAGVLASSGPMRVTRRVHDATPRTYEIPLEQMTAAELDAVREALGATRGGACSTRWRHPIDDPPGRVDEAPRFRITNAAELGGLAVGREPGGARASARLVLEEVTL